MPLRKLYLLWLAASVMAIGMGVVFFLTEMKITYGNFSGHQAFDGLNYFIESIIITVFSTGVLSALLVLINQKTGEAARRHIAKRLFSFYSVFALFCMAIFNFSFIYLNPLGLIVFATIPKLAWSAETETSQAKRKNWVFVGLLLAILLLGGLEFLNIVFSDPYRQ